MAVPTYRDALRLRPDDAALHIQFSTVLRESSDLGGSVAEAREAVRLAPANAEYQRELGNALFRMGDMQGAQEAYRAGIAQSGDVITQENLGLTLMRSGDWKGAAAAFRAVLKKRPESAETGSAPRS